MFGLTSKQRNVTKMVCYSKLQKKQKVPLFPPPYLKLLGTNHANDIFYIYKLKTMIFCYIYFTKYQTYKQNKQAQKGMTVQRITLSD